MSIHRVLASATAAFLLILGGRPAPAQAQLTNGLIFYTPFVNNSFNDIAGGQTATLSSSSPSIQTSGGVANLGGYLRLQNDATNPEQHLFFNDPTPATGNFTIQMWVRGNNPVNGQASGDPAIVTNKNWDSGGNVGWVVSAGVNGTSPEQRFQWNFNTQGGARKDYDPTTADATVFDGNWNHLVITHDRGGLVTFYVNGVQMTFTDTQQPGTNGAGTKDISGNAGQALTNAANRLVFGQDINLTYEAGNNSSLNADIDDVAMWNRSLSAVEVTLLYDNGRGVFLPVPEPSLAGLAAVAGLAAARLRRRRAAA